MAATQDPEAWENTGKAPALANDGWFVLPGKYVYAAGGYTGGARRAEVERATINADGSISDFASANRTLITARNGDRSIVHDGAVYVIGGLGSGGGIKTIERAEVNADGTLGPFVQLAQQLATDRHSMSPLVIGDYLYILGGHSDSCTCDPTQIERYRLPNVGTGTASVEVR
ncbi:MAG: hypothetical protein FJZ01_20010 [Candidatus Sericytochromatia bacterium]|nr:hypothetical protein [Candidatus Tanganyikabacteria bacterium]